MSTTSSLPNFCEQTHICSFPCVPILCRECSIDEMPKDIQPLGGDDGVKALEEAGFTDVKKTQVAIPLHVPSSVGQRDLFSFLVKPTPINVREQLWMPSFPHKAILTFKSCFGNTALSCAIVSVRRYSGVSTVCMLATPTTQYPVEVHESFK